MARENEMWIEGNRLKITVQNLPEFKELIEQAKKEAQQLNQTINRLSCFAIDIEFDTSRIKQD